MTLLMIHYLSGIVKKPSWSITNTLLVIDGVRGVINGLYMSYWPGVCIFKLDNISMCSESHTTAQCTLVINDLTCTKNTKIHTSTQFTLIIFECISAYITVILCNVFNLHWSLIKVLMEVWLNYFNKRNLIYNFLSYWCTINCTWNLFNRFKIPQSSWGSDNVQPYKWFGLTTYSVQF